MHLKHFHSDCSAHLKAVRQACCRFFIASATSSRRCSPVLGLGSGSREFLPAGEVLEGRERGGEQGEEEEEEE